MPTTTIDGHSIQVNDEGFLTDAHWEAIRFLHNDFGKQGETATLRRISVVGGIPTKALFQLFSQKPAKKLAYVAGLPKPHGCV